MLKHQILYICLSLLTTLHAQVNYNFENKILPTNLTIVNNAFTIELNYAYALKHNKNNITGFDCFYEKNTSINPNKQNIEWQFNIEHLASPSGNNRWLFWLMTDSIPTLATTKSGYAIGVNYTDISDTLKLYEISQNKATPILSLNINCQTNLIDSKNISITIKRTNEGNWQAWYTKNGINSTLVNTRNAKLNTFNYWGFNYFFTPSYAGKIYIDDIVIKAQQAQNISNLKIEQVEVVNTDSLQITFTEPFWDKTVNNSKFYITNYGNAHSFDIVSANTVKLKFNFAITKPTNVCVIVKDVADQSGNFMLPDTLCFNWHNIMVGSIVVSEIMFDPPNTGSLPPFEYIELYNNSGFDILLNNWHININNKTYQLPKLNFKADSVLILCNSKAGSAFAKYGNYFNLSTSATLLNNQTANIGLFSNKNEMIFYTQYLGNLVYDNGYAQGGVSVELNCYNNGCPTTEEWQINSNAAGGSPGTINKIDTCLTVALKLISLQLISNKLILLTFNRAINLNNANVLLNNKALTLQHENNNYNKATVLLPFTLENEQTYQLTLTNFTNCMGNLMPQTTINIALPQIANVADVLINEVLYETDSKNAEFVELYNNSNKIIDAGSLLLKVTNALNPLVSKSCYVAPKGTFFYPNSYIAVTRYPQKVNNWYKPVKPDSIWQTNLPILNNTGSLIELLNDTTNMLIDSITYNPSQHNPIIHSTKNVSLERTNTHANNSWWTSAAATVNYATPAYANSQQASSRMLNYGTLNLESDLLTPNNDGIYDNLLLNYAFNEPGWVASINIYTVNGTLHHQLQSNLYLPTQGIFEWNLQMPNGQTIANGMYILSFNAFNSNGNVLNKKLVFVVGK